PFLDLHSFPTRRSSDLWLNIRGEIMEQRKQVTEGIWMLAIYVLLLLVTLMIPVLSIFSIFFLPIPFVLYTRHFGVKGSLLLLVGDRKSTRLNSSHVSIS